MRRARAADLRPLAAFLLVLAAGVGLVLVWAAHPSAGASAPETPPAAGAPRSAPPPVAAGPIVPVRLQIPAIGVDAPVESRGTVRYDNPFTGQEVDGYGVPASMWTTSWWSDGPRPGSGQMAVILGHAQAAGGAVFDHLADLSPGDEAVLVDGGGAVMHLRMLGNPLTGLDKSTSALADALNGHPPGADVAFVTCGGRFDRQAQASEDNDVVFATVVQP